MRLPLVACLVAALGIAPGGCSSFTAAPDSPDGGGAPDASSDAGGPPAASCKGMKGTNGVYDIDPDGPGGAPPIHVYCDLTLDSGGWTLVGRSAPLGAKATPFGWRSNAGNVMDTNRPYSLDVLGSKLAFTEVLFADSALSLAYKFAVPSGFLTDYATKTVPTGAVTTVLGNCRPPAGPDMFQYSGGTSLNDVFFVRDVADTGQHRGLTAGGIDLASYKDCERGGLLDGLQGMILVR